MTLSAFRLPLLFQTCMSNFYARYSNLRAPRKLRARFKKYPLNLPLDGPGLEKKCSEIVEPKLTDAQ